MHRSWCCLKCFSSPSSFCGLFRPNYRWLHQSLLMCTDSVSLRLWCILFANIWTVRVCNGSRANLVILRYGTIDCVQWVVLHVALGRERCVCVCMRVCVCVCVFVRWKRIGWVDFYAPTDSVRSVTSVSVLGLQYCNCIIYIQGQQQLQQLAFIYTSLHHVYIITCKL